MGTTLQKVGPYCEVTWSSIHVLVHGAVYESACVCTLGAVESMASNAVLRYLQTLLG